MLFASDQSLERITENIHNERVNSNQGKTWSKSAATAIQIGPALGQKVAGRRIARGAN